MKKGYLFILCIIAALFLAANTHLKISLGDSIFRAIGISPWTKDNNNGWHLPVIISLILLIIGFVGAVKIYKEKYPKIVSRLIIGCIAFFLIMPLASEGVMFLVKRNSTSIHSIDISNSRCSYKSSEDNVEANCTFTIFNYGNVNVISIKPVIKLGINEEIEIEFESNTLSLDKRSKFNVNIPFSGMNKSKSSFSGSTKGPYLQFEMNVIE